MRTIYRDVEALCQAGVPIVTGQGQGGGIRLMDGFVLDRALMSAAEQERLMLAVRALSSATGDSGELLQKLGALFRAPGGGLAVGRSGPLGADGQAGHAL